MHRHSRLAGLIALALTTAGYGADLQPTGFDFMSAPTQRMQRDDALNPAMLWVQDGLARWSQREGAASVSCASCHGPTPRAQLVGVAARYPAVDRELGRVVDLGQRINLCRQRHQRAEPWALEDDALLALEVAIALESRGLPMAPPSEPLVMAAQALGEQLWHKPMGQLDLACDECHDQRVGRRLAGSVIPPGNAVGYPTYRLEWQALGSLRRRVRNCLSAVRAEPFAQDSPEMVALQSYLAARDRGLLLQAPAVRP